MLAQEEEEKEDGEASHAGRQGRAAGGGGGGVKEESVARSASRRLDIDSYRSILLDDTLERGAAGIFLFFILFFLFFQNLLPVFFSL